MKLIVLLLLATGIRPARIQFVPWMDGPHADTIHSSEGHRR